MTRREYIASGAAGANPLAPGVGQRPLIGGMCGARGLFTALVDLAAAAELRQHKYSCTEALIVLTGSAEAMVAGRRYVVRPYDTLLIPPETPNRLRSLEAAGVTTLFAAFASEAPQRTWIDPSKEDSDNLSPNAGASESITYFGQVDGYELAPGALFRNLFVGRPGCKGICGGYGLFSPGSGLPCHTHDYDESITIIQGRAICQVAGAEYEVSDCDTACVPTGRPHRFVNRSTEPMAMIWVYAGDNPDRVIHPQSLCEGSGTA